MAAMKLLKLSYLPQYLRYRPNFFTKSHVFGIKQYNKTHGHFIRHHFRAKIQNGRHPIMGYMEYTPVWQCQYIAKLVIFSSKFLRCGRSPCVHLTIIKKQYTFHLSISNTKSWSFLHLKAREPSEVEAGSAEKRTVATSVYTHWAGLIVFFAVSQLGIQERTVVK